MAKERLKIVWAGSLWMAVQYSAIHSSDPGQRREAKAMISTPARESLNAKLSWQRLMLILAANFRSTDLVVSLTYRDENLPKRREEAVNRVKAFIRRLREHRKSHGQRMKYVFNTEMWHSDGRVHHHFIVNSTGNDYEIIRSLWARNGDNIEFSPFGTDGAERWAKYFTKEPRVQFHRRVGEHTWHASQGMIKPVTEYRFVSDQTKLLPPPGGFILDRAECENCYGRFSYIMARLPETATEYKNSDLG